MADWRALQEGLLGGFQMGMASGGKHAGIGAAIGKVANKLKAERVAGQDLASKKNLLGFEGKIKEGLIRTEASLEPKTQPIVDAEGNVISSRPKGSVFRPKDAKKGMTLSQALSIVKDPSAVQQLKRTRPELIEEANKIITDQVGKGIESLMSLKNPGKKKTVTDNIMDTNW